MDNTIRKRVLVDDTAQESNKKLKSVDAIEPLAGEGGNGFNVQDISFAGVEKDPHSNYAFWSTMVFIQTPAEERRRRPHEQSSLREYPSIQDIDYLRPDKLKIETSSDVTLTSLTRPCTAAGGPVLRVGDIITLHVVGDVYKEIIGGFIKRATPAAQGPLQLSKPSLLISIPPGQEQELTSAHPNIIFPNDQNQDRATAPHSIWKAARTHFPAAARFGMEGKQLWERMSVTRGDEELGTLHEMRLALQFGTNESDFAAQLTFSEGRDRGSKNRQDGMARAGFFMLNSGTLFLKVPVESVASLDQDLLIDLGQELNEEMAALATNSFAIVMVDTRGYHADGLPISEKPKCLRNALTKGSNAFLTTYTKRIAGHSGFSNGYAHIGFQSLCRNDQGEIEVPAPFKYLYRTPAQPTVKVPEGEVLWTNGEKKAATDFYEFEISKDKIRHYPLPVTRSRRPLHIRTMQYRKLEEGWVVDSRVHPDAPVKDVVTDEGFAEAMTKPRTRPLPETKKVKWEGDGSSSGAAWVGYEMLGRKRTENGVPATGRYATIEERFAGQER
ncbi:hypothetical protein BKA64DRAFT_704776 [Cadophora sp. MPI-SDFR-AT-0126]|nr:hypothetical protein BKA64DRAFT_704776 [Leotiomycetes sp. MPI-SDFR-AT-0126]